MITRIANELACAFATVRCPDRVTLAEKIAAELVAAEARGRAAALADCVPVPRELFALVVAVLEHEAPTLAAELRAVGERKT